MLNFLALSVTKEGNVNYDVHVNTLPKAGRQSEDGFPPIIETERIDNIAIMIECTDNTWIGFGINCKPDENNEVGKITYYETNGKSNIVNTLLERVILHIKNNKKLDFANLLEDMMPGLDIPKEERVYDKLMSKEEFEQYQQMLEKSQQQ